MAVAGARTIPLVTVLFLFLGAVLLWAQPAGASCALPGDPREDLARADAAFVGELVSTRDVPGEAWPRTILIFRVRERIKGDLGRLVEVHDEIPGSSVSLSAPPRGRRVGLLLTRRHGRFVANNCDWISPRNLRGAAEGRPWPTAKRGLDRKAKVSFSLQGARLTVTVGRQAPPRVKRALRHPLRFFCKGYSAKAEGNGRFARRALRATVFLDKDIFEEPTHACAIKRSSGAKVASAYLVPSY